LDACVLFAMDTFDALPVVIVLILLASLLQHSMWASPIIFAMLFWSTVARTARTAGIKALTLDCMDVARTIGMRLPRLLVSQLWPLLRPIAFALTMTVIGNCLRIQMVLGFLGLDPSARANLGSLLNIATDDALGGRFWPLALVLVVSMALLITIEALTPRERLR
jgi:peptide/nickel transport system permease protein